MCCSLPPEMLDLIVDHLHDQPATLRVCCLVSKSWVPRTRTHLFAHVRLTSRFPFGSWAKAFPDPLNSPAHHTRSLTIQDYHSTWFAAAAGVDAGHWIRAFHNVVHLDINRHPFAPLHGLSPTVKSLRLALSRPRLSEVFDLMCSFPLLEDFSFLFYNYEDDLEGWTAPSTSPRLTGSFKLRSLLGIGPIPRRLLDLPNGLNFTRAILACDKETDFKLVTDLVEGCSNTLESLSIVNSVSSKPPSVPVPGHDRCLTAAHRPAHGDFVQPLHGCETQTIGVSVYGTWRAMGHRYAPNCRIQGPSRDHLATV